MYVHSVKLVNFKSFGDYDESEIILEPKITAIIGKNESGKSNIIEGLSKIRFINISSNAFAQENVNRSCSPNIVNEYVIILKPSLQDIEQGITEETKIIIQKETSCVTGALAQYYQAYVQPIILKVLELLESLGRNPFKLGDSELLNYNNHLTNLKIIDSLNLTKQYEGISYIQKRIQTFSAEAKAKFSNIMEELKQNWNNYITYFPSFFYRNPNKHLNAIYKLEEVEKELKSPTTNVNSLLYDFVKLLGVSETNFISATRSGNTPTQITSRKRIHKLVEEKINKAFQEFYQTEEISIDLDFNANAVSFSVQSNNGEALMLSERSNGLRWYLDTFIDAQANNISGRNIVYLLDEPGVYLHVKAQKELLGFFNRLAEQGNQIVYTTHSPYMLDMDNEGIHRIRATVKNPEGYTYVYKNAYDARIAPDCQKDTLAPIISALGMSLSDTFGPAKDKINIVTEGISDYIYFSMLSKIIGVDTQKYAIIPSVGATNCINVCSILHGWGCKYIAVFDYDKEGVEKGGEYLRREMLFELGKQYCYIADVSEKEISEGSYKASPIMIEDIITKTEINRFCLEKKVADNVGKSLKAKLMSNAVETGQYVLGEECIENFKKLFDRILFYME